MKWWILAVAALAAAAWWFTNRRVQRPQPPKLPGAAAEAVRAFDELYASTFLEANPCDADTVLDLTRLRDFVVGAVHARRMTLPNDMAADAAHLALAESSEDVMTAQLEDVRQRCGLGSDPSRLGGWHSGWYRPALNS